MPLTTDFIIRMPLFLRKRTLGSGPATPLLAPWMFVIDRSGRLIAAGPSAAGWLGVPETAQKILLSDAVRVEGGNATELPAGITLSSYLSQIPGVAIATKLAALPGNGDEAYYILDPPAPQLTAAALADALPGALCVYGDNGHILLVNQEFRSLSATMQKEAASGQNADRFASHLAKLRTEVRESGRSAAAAVRAAEIETTGFTTWAMPLVTGSTNAAAVTFTLPSAAQLGGGRQPNSTSASAASYGCKWLAVLNEKAAVYRAAMSAENAAEGFRTAAACLAILAESAAGAAAADERSIDHAGAAELRQWASSGIAEMAALAGRTVLFPEMDNFRVTVDRGLFRKILLLFAMEATGRDGNQALVISGGQDAAGCFFEITPGGDGDDLPERGSPGHAALLMSRRLTYQSTASRRTGNGSFTIRLAPGPPETSANLLGEVSGNGIGQQVLIIEDEGQVRKSLSLALTLSGYAVLDAPDVAGALTAAKGQVIHFIIADYGLGGGVTGIDAIQAVRKAAGVYIPAALLTGRAETDLRVEAREHDIAVYTKPVDLPTLKALLYRK